MTQQVGFAEVDVQELGVSAAAFSLHKGLNCPTGFAVLYFDPAVTKGTDTVPLIVGYGAVSNTRADLLIFSDPVVYHPSAQRYEHLYVSDLHDSRWMAHLKENSPRRSRLVESLE